MDGDPDSRPPSATALDTEHAPTTTAHQHHEQESAVHADAKIESASASSRSKQSSESTQEAHEEDVNNERLEVISANDVLKALRAFVEETNKHRSM